MTNPNESAYPIEPGQQCCTGLTKREHFAALAMQGLLARGPCYEGLHTDALYNADALIEALNRQAQ